MAMLNNRNSGGFHSEINITPLVDVVLVLLIIFMVVSPQARRWYEVQFAGSAATERSEPAPLPSLTLSIASADCPIMAAAPDRTAVCRVRINDDAVDLNDLRLRMEELYRQRQDEDRVLFIRVEERFNYEAAMRIIDQARSGVADLRIGMVLQGAGPAEASPAG